MLQVTPHMRIWVAKRPLDFRNGIDGTAAVCRVALQKNPMEGALFVFRNKRGTMIRALVYDGQGFWVMTKRLSQGKFAFWHESGADASVLITPHQLQTLLAAGDWRRNDAPGNFRCLGQMSDRSQVTDMI